MENNLITVLTATQGKYLLMQGETLIIPMKGEMGYLTIDNGDDTRATLSLQYDYSSRTDYIIPMSEIEATLKDMLEIASIYVSKGAKLQIRKLNRLEKIRNWIIGLFTK